MERKRELIYESSESLIYKEKDDRGKSYITKVLRPNFPTPEQILQFNNEYEFTKDLEVVGVRRAIEKTREDEHYVLHLEYIDGISLNKAFLNKERPLDEILDAFIKIADTLNKIHEKRIIHKDLHGGNILWLEEEKRPVIIDFGISTKLNLVSNYLGNPEKVKGLLSHMPPEQTGRVNRKVDNRSDLYMLGVTMFQLLTGDLPFKAKDSLELVHHHIAKTPPLAHRINETIPDVFSDIISKLMAKNAEDRYQSAYGLKNDLEECLSQLKQNGRISHFKIAQNDKSGNFQIPEKLYGRYDEVKQLIKAFERISRGSTELFLVAGYSGVGKSALIAEIYKPITERRGYFVSGKFDQYQKNIPYYAIIKAFTEFCDHILSESEERLEYWKNLILEAVGQNGKVLTDLIPAFETIIGPQPEVPKLEAQQAQNRLNLVFQNLCRGISKPEHPFVLFCDDLQWADVGSLNLLQLLVTDTGNTNMLVIGAYRDNEVDAGHPLLTVLEEAEKNNAIINDINLQPLQEEHVHRLISDSLDTEDQNAQDLTEIVYSKTLGNPFFTKEFLKALYESGLIHYNFEATRWEVQFEDIKKRNITNNVVDLLVDKLKELPTEEQDVLKFAACIGGHFNLEVLSKIYKKDQKETLNNIWFAIDEGMIIPANENYQYITIDEVENPESAFKFAHDRIQQAAYSLLSGKETEHAHLEIARILNQQRENDPDLIFDIVSHYSKGIKLVSDKKEQEQITLLGFEAATMAKESGAYTSAREFVSFAIDTLGDDYWKNDKGFAIEINQLAAEIEYLNGNTEESLKLINLCLENTDVKEERSALYILKIYVESGANLNVEAIESARQGLKLESFDFPNSEDCEALIPAEMGKILGYLQENGVDSLYKLKEMKDEQALMQMKLLDNISMPSYVSGDINLWILHVLYKVNLTIEKGITPQGSYAFIENSLIFFILANYEYAWPVAKVSKHWGEHFQNRSRRHVSRMGHLYTNYCMPWVNHIHETAKLIPNYYQLALDSGELIFAGYLVQHTHLTADFEGKDNIGIHLSKIPEALEFCRKIKHDLAYDSVMALKMVLSNLAGKTNDINNYDVEEFKEEEFLAHCMSIQEYFGVALLYKYKAQAQYMLGQYPEAAATIQQALPFAAAFAGSVVLSTNFNLYASLTLLEIIKLGGDNTDELWATVEQNQAQMEVWATNNAANFEHKHLLVKAEIANIKGQTMEAMDLYQQAIKSAEENDFDRELAIIHQKAGEFWIKQDNLLYAHPHLQKTKYLFERLGYSRPSAMLSEKYASVFVRPSASSTIKSGYLSTGYLKSQDVGARYYKGGRSTPMTGTLSATERELDMISIFKASQTLSEEIVMDKLMVKILHLLIENAGGQRAVLLLAENNDWNVAADLNLEEDLEILESRSLAEVDNVPKNVINYVIRTKGEVISDDGGLQKVFEKDDYINNQNPASFLCLPLIYKSETNGIIYVEHRTSMNAFTAERFDVLKLLTSQMAVSLENAMLYEMQTKLNKAYQRFVPTEFIHALGHEGILQVTLGDHIDQDMTVMFCDIRSYSTLAENMTTEENFHFLIEYLNLVGPVIRENNGFINHYFGDGFMAIFKESPEDALNASVGILNEINTYNEKRTEAGQKAISIGFGLHRGQVMMGIIGDTERHDANVISDAVNTASRLEGLCKMFGANIIISQQTLDGVTNNDKFKFRYLGKIQVHGKEDVMDVYEMFEADKEEIRIKKEQTLEHFNEGLREYFDRNFAMAAVSLKQVLNEDPRDKTAKRYLQNAAKFMVEGVDDSWTGVEQLTEK